MVKSKQCFHIESIHCLRINTLYILRYELPKISNSFNKFDEMFFQEFVSRFFQWIFLPHILKPLFKKISMDCQRDSLGENAAAAHRSQGVISPAGFHLFRPKNLPTEAGMEIEFLHNRVKMAQEHLLRPGPENKGFHGVWKTPINRELSELSARFLNLLISNIGLIKDFRKYYDILWSTIYSNML